MNRMRKLRISFAGTLNRRKELNTYQVTWDGIALTYIQAHGFDEAFDIIRDRIRKEK